MSAKALRETLGFAGVIGSLVFVGLELKQTNRLAEAAAYQAVGVASAAAWDTQTHDRAFVELQLKTPEEMSAADWVQWRNKFTVWARLGETTLLQVEREILPPDAMLRLGFAGWSRIFEPSDPVYPKIACVWPGIRGAVSESFRDFVEQGHDWAAVDCSGFAVPGV
jgi:hypothetical protein